jgi:hypothetical protein
MASVEYNITAIQLHVIFITTRGNNGSSDGLTIGRPTLMWVFNAFDYLSKNRSFNGEAIATSVIVPSGYEDNMELDSGDI